MDQKDIDALFNQGSISEFNKKQDELIKSLAEKEKRDVKKGKVIGQLSRVSEESEAGTNLVMGYLENVLTVISKQQSFIKDITGSYQKNPAASEFLEALSFMGDNMTAIEDLIFSAMDAFQFQDIGRQKLLKVMYTLSKLNQYLNELLGGEESREKTFGHQIEKRTLEKDKDKDRVDTIIDTYKTEDPEPIRPTPPPPPAPTSTAPSIPKTPARPPSSSPGPVVDNADVDSIIREFQERSKGI